MTDTTDTADIEGPLDPRRMARLQEAAESGDRVAVEAALEGLHPADIADILEQIGPSDREAVLALWSGIGAGDVLSELDEGLREDVIDQLEPEALAAAVRDLETDDIVDLVEDLQPARQQVLLDVLDDADRFAVQQALRYPEGCAGRLMQREVLTAPEHWTVGEAIDYIRRAETLPDQFYHVTLVDPSMRPVANVTLGRLLAAAGDAPLRSVAEDMFFTIPVTETEENVAYAFNQYHLIAAPVVDHGGRLVGIITIDDAMYVLSEAQEDDILKLAGVGETSMTDTLGETVRARLPWLAVNLATAILASVVIAQFDAVLASVVALAILMPIVASMGGNAGTQSLTVAVRALATRDLTGANMWRVVRREGAVGLLNGVVFAIVMGAIGWIWFGSAAIAGVLAMAMVINLLVAGLSGILIPVALDRMRLDPALASGTFVTTVTDVVGFFAFLGIATAVLT